jgi:hypothetical protein
MDQADTTPQEAQLPPDLPTDAAHFYAEEAAPLPGLPVGEPSASALQRLGAPPMPRGRFPLLGFLATVYDELAEHARRRLGL